MAEITGLPEEEPRLQLPLPAQRIGEIIAGKLAVTADTVLRLAFEVNVARLVTAL